MRQCTVGSCGMVAAAALVAALVAVPAAAQTSWQYRVVGGDGTYGRLEVLPPSSTSWGSVCDDSFGLSDAQVACRSLGQSSSSVSYRSVRSGEYPPSSQTFWMDDLACTGTESDLSSCSRSTSHNCVYLEAIVVRCGSTLAAPTLTNLTTYVAPTPAPAGNARGAYEYRLVGGSTTYGRLETRPVGTSTWGTVCDDSFGLTDARVACRSLGLTTTTVGYRTVSYTTERGPSTQPTYMDDLACTGTEPALHNCSQSAYENCAASEAVALSCGTSTVPSFSAGTSANSRGAYEYRLVGGSSTHGRLETRPVGTTTWGTVCDDSFGLTDARVACRSLGLTTTTVGYRTVSYSEQGSYSQPTYMDDLACAGTEAALHNCSQSAYENCGSSEAVALSCGTSSVPSFSTSSSSTTVSTGTYEYRLVDGDNATYGRLEVRPTGTSTWGTVCDDWFGSSDATVACRSLGLTTTTVGYRTVYYYEQGSYSQPTYMDDLSCSGTEAHLGLCTRSSTENCASSEAVALACGRSSVPTWGTAPTTNYGSVPFTDDHWQYRLVGGDEATYGRVEVRPNASSAWGTVCDDSFGSLDARVVCRALGLTESPAGYRTAYSGERGSDSQPIWMDNLACSGTEAAPHNCSGTMRHNCWHSEDVTVACGRYSVPVWGSTSYTPYTPSYGTTSSPASEPWQYRLVGGDGTYGRLEVRQYSSSSWGTVCDDSFGYADARVACRSLNLSTTTYGYRTVFSGESGTSTQPIRFDNVACSGSEPVLHNCTRVTSHNCAHSEDVALSCGRSYVPSFAAPTSPTTYTGSYTSGGSYEYRLVGGSAAHGRLEVRRIGSAAWGTVCDDYFGYTDAQVACRSLGFTGMLDTISYRTAYTTVERGDSMQSIEFDDLQCTGGEAALADCQRAVRHNCWHAEDVLLSCNTTSVPTLTGNYTTTAVRPPSSGGATVNVSTRWQFRLVGGASNSTGRLEVIPPGVAEWGTVCDDAFGSVDAQVACRSVGFANGTASYRTVTTAEQGLYSQPIYLDDVRCTGGEAHLGLCARAARHNCWASEAVHLTCTGTYQGPTTGSASVGTGGTLTGDDTSVEEDIVNGEPWYYRLVGGSAPNTGRLEVFAPAGARGAAVNGTWGTVCDDFFGYNDAFVACRALGMDTSRVRYRTARYSLRGAESQPILMDNLQCSGYEGRLDQCQRQPQHNCRHYEDVELTCGELPVPVRSTVRLGGSGWASIVQSNDAARIAALRLAILRDLMRLLGILLESMIRINRLSVGSLVVDFEVNATTAAEAANMSQAINSTANMADASTTFGNITTLYATETPEGQAGETIGVLNAAAVEQPLAEESDADAGVSTDAPKPPPASASAGGRAVMMAGAIAAAALIAVAGL